MHNLSLSDLLAVHKHSIISELHTMMPGRIIKYYPATQTADVQPMVKKQYFDPDGTKAYRSYPAIPGVPVEFPGGGGCTITFPLAAGDTVDIVFAESSLADYLSSGEESAQQDVGRHKLGYCVLHPVRCPAPRPSTDAATVANNVMVIGQEGGLQIQIDMVNGNILAGSNATDFVALATKVQTAIADLATWVKTGMCGGVSVTYATPAPTDSVAATVLKAK